MKQAADHALQGRRDARAKHVREVYGATGVAAAAFGAPGAEAPAARAKSITRPRDAGQEQDRRHEERTTPLRSPAPRSPRQPPSAQPRSPASPAVVNTQARRTPPASPPVPSLAAQKVPAALVRASAAPGTKIADDDLERAASDFEARVAAELERFQDDRRRRVARAALPQNAGGALEALAEKIQQAPDLRTLAGMPPAAPRAAAAGALSPDAIADRWQRDHPLPGAKARRGPAPRASRRQNTVEQSLAGESSFHAFIDPADEAITSPAPPETFEDLADRIPDESFDSTLGA